MGRYHVHHHYHHAGRRFPGVIMGAVVQPAVAYPVPVPVPVVNTVAVPYPVSLSSID